MHDPDHIMGLAPVIPVPVVDDAAFARPLALPFGAVRFCPAGASD
jgi:hypothetical protein